MRIVIRSTDFAKNLAKNLKKASERVGEPMMLSYAQVMVARSFGYSNWHEMAASCVVAPEEQPRDPEFYSTIVAGLKKALEERGWADVADAILEGAIPKSWRGQTGDISLGYDDAQQERAVGPKASGSGIKSETLRKRMQAG